MKVIPLQRVPSQTVNVTLGEQVCQINVYQKDQTVYLDLYVVGTLIIGGVACFNRNVLVRSAYLGFIGDLAFVDIEDDRDPVYGGFGIEFFLVYFDPAELITMDVL